MKANEYLKEPYSRILIPDEEGFFAEILEFPGCYAHGKSVEDAFKKLDKAALSWIEASLEQGHEIPPPSTNAGYGGKVALRLPRSLHKRAAKLAHRDGVSLNQFLTTAIAARVGAEEFNSYLAENTSNRIIGAINEAISQRNMAHVRINVGPIKMIEVKDTADRLFGIANEFPRVGQMDCWNVGTKPYRVLGKLADFTTSTATKPSTVENENLKALNEQTTFHNITGEKNYGGTH